MDKVGVRQAGGLGGDRPVCRVDGLKQNNRKKTMNKFHLGSDLTHSSNTAAWSVALRLCTEDTTMRRDFMKFLFISCILVNFCCTKSWWKCLKLKQQGNKYSGPRLQKYSSQTIFLCFSFLHPAEYKGQTNSKISRSVDR